MNEHREPLACERRGSGAPLLLLHGYPLDRRTWEEVADLLEPDFDLILPDLRGFGASPLPPGPGGVDAMAQDLAELLDGLAVSQALVAGHSMGGYVALAFARLFPQRLLGLGLVATQAGADGMEAKAGRRRAADEIRARGAVAAADAMVTRFTEDPQRQADLRELILRQRTEGLIAALEAMAERPDALPQLRGIECAVAIVHGSADALIPLDRAQDMARALPGATLTELPGIGHLPMLDAPKATADALRALKPEASTN